MKLLHHIASSYSGALGHGDNGLMQSAPEAKNKVKVKTITLQYLRQAFLTDGIPLHRFQGLFFVLFLCCSNVSIEIFTSLVEFVGIAPQREIVAGPVIEFAEHGIGLPFQCKLRAE